MLPAWINSLPFRLGTTSYIIPDEILPNVRYLAGKVKDVELILFELDDGPNNLPDEATLSELRYIAEDRDLTFTIHLPLDLDLGAEGSAQRESLEKARRVIERVQGLEPWAYVLHLDGESLHKSHQSDEISAWLERAAQALKTLCTWVGSCNRLAVENLEGYPAGFNLPVIDRLSTAQCIDIGHLWKDGVEPVAYLTARLPFTRVIHLHGIGERDHQSLAHMAAHQVDEVLSLLTRASYSGVITIEVFSESDLNDSLQTIYESLKRVKNP
jgi:sugar phosphate isomerase/epimerase